MSDRRQLEDLRRQMADIDVEILRALERRARVAREAATVRGSSPLTLPAQEREQLQALEAMAQEELPPGAVASVLREVHATTLALEQPVRVAYVAPEGGFCHLAARQQFGAGAVFVAAEGGAEAFDEVMRGRADFAVVPFESSLEGPLQSSIMALVNAELMLIAETEVFATFSLMSRTGNLTNVDKLYATAADRVACQRWLGATLPKATVVDVRSPVVACQLASDDHGAAAVVPEACGVAEGLVPVKSNIGDHADLRIRFGVAAARPTSRTGSDTTAFVFIVHDQPGALFDALKHFAERGINLLTIHSRPMPGEKWNYLFYVEVSGHVSDRPIVTALEAIKRQTRLVKVLGSFPSL